MGVQVRLDHDDAAGPTIMLSGEIDLQVAPTLREAGDAAIAHAAGNPVHIDLSGVTFLDSTGIGALVAISNAAHDKDVPLRLRSVPEKITKLLSITGLDDVFVTE
jgi:anti-sigma B factor antagonist